MAIFTEPHQFVDFTFSAVAFDDQAYGSFWALWGVWDSGREEEHLAFSNINGFWLAIGIDNFNLNIAFKLEEKFFSFFPMVVFSSVWSAYDHNDEVIVIDKELFVAHGRFEQVAIFFDPVVQVKGTYHSNK